MFAFRLLVTVGVLSTAAACSGGGGGGGGSSAFTGLEAAFTSGVTVELTWENEADGATEILVERATDDGGPFEAAGAPAAGNATEYIAAGLEVETEYFFRLTVVGGADDGKRSSVVSPGAPLEIPDPPPAPNSINTTVIGPSEIDVEWTHSGENVIGFRVERLMNYTGWSYVQIADLPATARDFSDTCLRPQSPFKYRVTAYNEVGNTDTIETLPNTTTLTETSVPMAPTNLEAVRMTPDSYRIQWVNPCSQATLILIEVSVNGGAYQNVLPPETPHFSSDATYFYYVDLPQDSTYVFRATALNGIAGATSSATATATGPTTPEPPTGGWVGIRSDYDNRRAYADLVPSVTNTANPSGELIAGCFWNFNTFLGVQNFICYSSAIHFPLSGTAINGASFNLAGKTINEAVLVLSVADVPINPTNLYLHAIATPWNTNTLNGATFLDLYSDGGRLVGSPGLWGPYGIDVTTIVQNWANGTFQNNGVLLEDAEYVFPYNSLIRTSFFWSTDTFNGSQDNRPTLWVDYQ